MSQLPTILLVDDDSTTNFLNQRLLQCLHVSEEVQVATNGVQALALLQARYRAAPGPVLILLDVNMPVMNGFEFLDAYVQLPLAQRATTVVVMLTTSLLAQDQVRTQNLPVAAFLNKPLTREHLTQVLERHFGLAMPVA